MKTLFHAYIMCRSMFCAIPSPQIWDEKARNRMLPFLPLVGVEIGLYWWLLSLLCRTLSLPALMTGLVLCLYPCLVTGCIHLDGFMDVKDAISSWRDLDRRREILKDSHVGSFAVIGVALVLLGQFAALASLSPEGETLLLLWIPVVSRCGSALAVTALKPLSTSQYAGQARPRGRIVCLIAELCLALTGGFLTCGMSALALLAGIAAYALALGRAYRSLEGMNGDVAGYALTLSETGMLVAWVLLQTWLKG